MPDVIVIGGGIIGCSCACELARRGARVTVLETRTPGQGATQASAGVLAPFIEAPSDSALQRLCIAGLDRWDDFIATLRRESRADFEYQRTGTIEVALDDAETALLERTADLLRTLRVPHDLLRGPAALSADVSISRAATAALIVSSHGFVSVPSLTAALLEAAAAHGVRVMDHVSVTAVNRLPADTAAHRQSGLRVSTSAGPFDADFVLLAAGSWSGLVPTVDAPPVPVRPVRGQLLHLAWKSAPLSRVVWGSRCYMVPWTDGTVLVGATVEEAGFAEETTVAGIQSLIAAATELVPETAAAGFKQARVGLRPASADTLPIVGLSPDLPGLCYATGHYRNGILLAPLTAEIVADTLLQQRSHPLLPLVSPTRQHAFAATAQS